MEPGNLLIDTSIIIDHLRKKNKRKSQYYKIFGTGEIYLSLKSENKLIEIKDLFIAATALSHSLPLMTLNVKHFDLIEELRIL